MCGFVGIIGIEHATAAATMSLQAIQHRGQDAAGLAVWDPDAKRYHMYKDLGMVTSVLTEGVVRNMPGQAAIGHVRYPTFGGSKREDAQPFLSRFPGVILCHNGNVTNVPALEDELRERGWHALSRCDSETILLVFVDELTQLSSSNHTLEHVQTALRGVMRRVGGAYSVAAVLQVDGETTLAAFRDPWGVRPAVYGRRPDGAWMVASESVALDVLGFEVVGHVPAGGMVVMRDGQEAIVLDVAPQPQRHCIFERIYFARADSVMEDGRVNSMRWRLGEQLADELTAKGIEADVVVAVPDTSRPAAMAIGERLKMPTREGFIKNRYSGRTFIMPDQTTRDAALRLKLNPIREEFEGKRVILLDDSIVRGSTMRRILRMVKKLDPKEIHLAIFSPPVAHPCFYGIDMPSHDELIAAGRPHDQLEAELTDYFGVDSVTYLSLEGLREVAGNNHCAACFTGEYPIAVSEEERAYILHDRRLSG